MPSPDPSRRRLLGTVRDVAAAAAAAAALPAGARVHAPLPPAAPAAQSPGYRESAHIRTYYRLARY